MFSSRGKEWGYASLLIAKGAAVPMHSEPHIHLTGYVIGIVVTLAAVVLAIKNSALCARETFQSLCFLVSSPPSAPIHQPSTPLPGLSILEAFSSPPAVGSAHMVPSGNPTAGTLVPSETPLLFPIPHQNLEDRYRYFPPPPPPILHTLLPTYPSRQGGLTHPPIDHHG